MITTLVASVEYPDCSLKMLSLLSVREFVSLRFVVISLINSVDNVSLGLKGFVKSRGESSNLEGPNSDS